MIAVNAILPQQQPSKAGNYNCSDHRRVTHLVRQTTRRDGPRYEGETQHWNRVRQQPLKPHRLVFEKPRRDDCSDEQSERRKPFAPACAAEEHPPCDDDKKEGQRAEDGVTKALYSGKEFFNTEPEYPLQHDGDDARPHSEQLLGILLPGLGGSHAGLYCPAIKIVSLLFPTRQEHR